VSEDGNELYLGDFGFSTNEEFTNKAGICGTISYMAPETFVDENSSNEFKDRWALAITALYIALTGIQPWERALKRGSIQNQVDLHYDEFCRHPSVLHERFPISKGFEKILRQLLHPLPTNRMELSEMKEAIKKLPRFLMTPDELELAGPEAREVAIDIGLLPEPDMDDNLVDLDGTTLCESSTESINLFHSKASDLIPIRRIYRSSISPATRAVLNRQAGITATSSSSCPPSLSSRPISDDLDASNSDSDEGPDTPETLPSTTDDPAVADDLVTDVEVPSIEQAMKGLIIGTTSYEVTQKGNLLDIQLDTVRRSARKAS
jgi:serine/threonine protein kinase